MKKKYMKPQMGVFEVEPTKILTMSGTYGGNASQPGKAPMYDNW